MTIEEVERFLELEREVQRLEHVIAGSNINSIRLMFWIFVAIAILSMTFCSVAMYFCHKWAKDIQIYE